jgi:hypothetical protein
VSRRLLGLVLVALGACSSSHTAGPSTPTTATTTNQTTGWDPTAIATAKTLVLKIQHAFPGQCNDPGLLPHGAYLATMKRLHLKIPLAVVDCHGFAEGIELSVFADAAERARYVSGRAISICRSAVRGKYDLPGLHWVVGPNFALEPESEGVSREIAPVLDGTYLVTPCPGHTQIDWAPAAEATVAQLAGTLAAAPRVGCKSFHLLNRDQYVKIRAYAGRLPAAYGTCTGIGDTVIWIAVLSSATVSPGSFVSSESTYQCRTQPGVTAVRGSSWALFIPQVKVAALAAVATGGTALPSAC